MSIPGFSVRDDQRKLITLLEQVRQKLNTPDSYTVATLPAAADNPRLTVYVSDEAGGAVLAFSDGTSWRRVTDRAVVS